MTIFAEDFQARPYWWEAAAPTHDTTDLPPETSVAIVGGGYTGLSAALTLRRLGHEVAVMDAEPIGFGASSRNGGMVSGGLKLAAGRLVRTYGAARARAIAEAAAASFPFIEDLIAREAIDCDYIRCGRFVPASTPGHYEALAAKADRIAAVTGLPTRMVPRWRQRRELASDYYFGGMVVEATGSLHPAKYAAGLAGAARRAGAVLVGGARVDAIERDGSGFALRTGRGVTRARHVLVATNGYSHPGPMPWLARRVIPVASYIIATQPIGEDRVRPLFPTGRMIADTKRVLNYFRPSPDFSRILWGGRASFRASGAAPERAAITLWNAMLKVFPSLRDVRITHAWTGNVAFTLDGLPHIGERGGFHYAAGCQGSGVAMMSWLGHQVALKIAGAANAPFPLDGEMPTLPAYDGRPWFLPLAGEWMRARDRIDRAFAVTPRESASPNRPR